MTEVDRICILPSVSIREAIACIDLNRKGIALVVDEEGHLLGTLTDGDIRRVILAGLDLSTQVTEILKSKVDSLYPQPITVLQGTSNADLLKLMNQYSIRHIPLLDDNSRIVNLVTLEDLLSTKTLPVTAVIMAGGYGKRLQPLTNEVPKPMLLVGGHPTLEWIINGLSQCEILDIVITTYYKAEVITEYFGDGHNFGVQIQYIHENQLSGTAGALGLLSPWNKPLLVINGDILTKVDFKAMLNYHQENKADMTIAVREYLLQVPYGIVEMEGIRVHKLTEKPSLRFFVNAGIYLLEPLVHSYIPKSQFTDITDVIIRLLEDSHSLIGFPIREYWIDIGQHSDYQQAQQDMKNGGLSQ